jgi:hypothetical protein
MGVPEPRAPQGEIEPEVLLRVLERLCAVVDESRTEPQMLQLGFDTVRTALGDRVAIDLRDGRHDPPDDATRHLPLVGGGRVHGALCVTDADVEDRTVLAFAAVAARVLGIGLDRHRAPTALASGGAGSVPHAVHRIRGASATIGVATSAMRARGDDIDAAVRERLQTDIEVSVEVLRAALDELLAAIGGGGRDGG